VANHLPHFPFYVSDFEHDPLVEIMDATEVGAYLLLLLKAWRQNPPGSVPNNDQILAQWVRMDAESWAQRKQRVMAPWKLRNGRWYQKRMRREYDLAVEKYKKAAQKRNLQVHKGAVFRSKNGHSECVLSGNSLCYNSNSDSLVEEGSGGEADFVACLRAVLPDADEWFYPWAQRHALRFCLYRRDDPPLISGWWSSFETLNVTEQEAEEASVFLFESTPQPKGRPEHLPKIKRRIMDRRRLAPKTLEKEECDPVILSDNPELRKKLRKAMVGK
jgi:uncharacterized protein YdaU (DUF1376 family)